MKQIEPDSNRPFIGRIQPALSGGGFAMEDYWIWCPSVVRDEEGVFHMFASRWPKSLAFAPHWLTNSEIVRATSSNAGGPYVFREVVLPRRGSSFWDGCMTHNPRICRHGRKWLLYYTGTTYNGEIPVAGRPMQSGDLVEVAKTDHRIVEAHGNQRIGLAASDSPEGPWERPDVPILQPRPGGWDSCMTTNPAPCVTRDGHVLLIYKSAAGLGKPMHLGCALATDYNGVYKRLSESPIFEFGGKTDVEDPFVWHEDGRYCAIMKDMTGRIGGEPRGGIHAGSPDGVRWRLMLPFRAYSRRVKWSDGSVSELDFLERPSLLLDENNHPTHFFAAAATGSSHIGRVNRSWNLAAPVIR